MENILVVAVLVLCTLGCTAAGSALVYCFKEPSGEHSAVTQASGKSSAVLAFAGGIMLAAAVWCLLIPACDLAKSGQFAHLPFLSGVPVLGEAAGVPVAGGFILGALVLMLLDKLLPHLHFFSDKPEGLHVPLHGSSLTFIAVIIHNIPEGLAVGAGALAAASLDVPGAEMAFFMLALGMGIQNIPESAVVSVLFSSSGMSRLKAFAAGTVTGVFEVAAALAVYFAGSFLQSGLPWMLAAAAGAMLYVVTEELIPKAHEGGHSDLCTLSVLAGFLLMMLLDISFA